MRLQQENTNHISTKSSSSISILLVIALLSDLLTPLLIWKGILPASTRWISDAVIVIIIALVYTRMMVFNKIPAALLVIVALSLIGIAVALFNGQGILATVWGWWLMFKYPLVGLYFYLQPSWPKRFPQHLRTVCIVILIFEVFVQIGQYLTGEPIGDNLAGTFGWHGTGPLVSYTLFVLCLVLGQWLVERRWRNLALVMVLGIVSSVLGEIKFFLPASLAVLCLGFAIFILQSGQVWKLVPYVIFLGISVAVFIVGYNTFVPNAEKVPIESFITDSGTLDSYMNKHYQSKISGNYIMGRSLAVQYGWDSKTRDPITFIFGMGIGARGESRSLTTAGIALTGSAQKYSVSSSLLVLMQEMGLLGLTAIGVFIFWIAISQFRAIGRAPQSPVSELRYALVLFSLLWPLWVYYATVWNQEVVMLLYWSSLGYIFGAANWEQDGDLQPHLNSTSSLHSWKRTYEV